jgi:asparagine synthase (glutamine-hydrolysing)
VLDSDQLADPDVRAKVIGARDLPNGQGDMDASLYLLFKAIRGHSTVALSGESADEVFGGYLQYFDEDARKADTFPWLALTARHMDAGGTLLNPGLVQNLRLGEYVQDAYRTSVSRVDPLPGESKLESRMREICYLHLTHFVRNLLDRKDRMSMAVGLEVRVPFCDHRLVEYVYNTPWSLKNFDGREKSLLRAATADVLPQSVVERVKSPYPSTQDPEYARKLQGHVRDLPADHQVFDIVDRATAQRLVNAPEVSGGLRYGLERTLDIAIWLDMYKPVLKLS